RIAALAGGATTSINPMPDHSSSNILCRLAVLVALCGLCFVLSMASIGVGLAILGRFTPVFVIPLVSALTVGLTWYLVRKFSLPSVIPPHAGTKATMIVLLGIATITAVNMRYPAQHMAINRDAGAYTVSSLWLAENGNLQPPGLRGPFRESGRSGELKNEPKLK